MGTEREGSDDMSQRRSGQNIGNNHNLADVYFDSNFYYLKKIYLEHKSNIIKL